MKKDLTRWVSRLLNSRDQKCQKLNISKQRLELVGDLMRSGFITTYQTTNNSLDSGSDSSAPKKARTIPSGGKVMANVMDKLNNTVKSKRPYLMMQKVHFRSDN